MYLVYKHASPSGKSYIGLTGDYDKRCREHQSAAFGNHIQCEAFHAAVRKYGWDNFLHEILYTDLTIEEANWREQQCINEYGTMAPCGYNLTSGGAVTVLSAASRMKISRKRLGMKFSDETRAIMSAQRKGRDAGKPKPGVVAAQSLQWIVTDPHGSSVNITNLAQFCRDNNLTHPCMMDVVKGKQKQHKGWVCRRA